MVFRTVLFSQILLAVTLSVYTVQNRSDIWQRGRQLELHRREQLRLLENQQVLDVFLTRARVSGRMRDTADQMQICLVAPREENFHSELARIRKLRMNQNRLEYVSGRAARKLRRRPSRF